MDALAERIQAARRIVVKVGSAVLSSEDGLHFDRPAMAALAQGVTDLRSQGREVVLVSSGAILAGAQTQGLPLPVHSIGEKQALAALGQAELMRRWSDIFSWHEIRVAQVLLTRDDLSHRRRFLNSRRTLGHLLEHGILPVINENDTVMVEEIKLGDNDQLSALVTNLVTADLLILLTEVDGLFTADPRADPSAERVERIDDVTPEIRQLAGAPGPAGRGGMATKLEAARQASLFGVPTVIANGRHAGVLASVLAGEALGTRVAPLREKLDSRKHWIAFSHAPVGRLVLDDGAVTAIRDHGKSLLPSGIVAVQGTFEMGDAIELVSSSGAPLARGLASYGASEVEQIKGRQTQEIEAVLGYRYGDEVVHRDHLVVETRSGPK